jgi:hypothetical protein
MGLALFEFAIAETSSAADGYGESGREKSGARNPAKSG